MRYVSRGGGGEGFVAGLAGRDELGGVPGALWVPKNYATRRYS